LKHQGTSEEEKETESAARSKLPSGREKEEKSILKGKNSLHPPKNKRGKAVFRGSKSEERKEEVRKK